MPIQPPGTIGRLMYDARRARGWTRPHVARLINEAGGTMGVNQQYVYRWETGQRKPDAYFDAVVRALGLDPAQAARAAHFRAPQPATTTTPALETDPMLRRSLLGGTAAAATSAGPLQRISAAFATGPLDRGAAERLVAAAAALYADEETTAAPLLLDRACAHMDVLTAAIPRAGANRNDLIVAAGETAALAGWLAWDLERVDEAVGYYEAARAASREASHPALDALVLTYASYGVADPRKAADFLREAQRRLRGPGYATASAWSTARTAEELAKAGDEHGALRALERAETVYDYAAPSREQPWVRFMRPLRLDSLKVSTLSTLRHPEAVQAADDSLARLPDDDDSKVSIAVRTDAASAYLSAGEADRAIATARRALRTVAGYAPAGMTMGRLRLAAITQALPDTGAARVLREEVQATLAA